MYEIHVIGMLTGANIFHFETHKIPSHPTNEDQFNEGIFISFSINGSRAPLAQLDQILSEDNTAWIFKEGYQWKIDINEFKSFFKVEELDGMDWLNNIVTPECTITYDSDDSAVTSTRIEFAVTKKQQNEG